MSGAICNGVLGETVRIWRCPRCRTRRCTRLLERYDSWILICSKGHEFVADSTELHYCGKVSK